MSGTGKAAVRFREGEIARTGEEERDAGSTGAGTAQVGAEGGEVEERAAGGEDGATAGGEPEEEAAAGGDEAEEGEEEGSGMRTAAEECFELVSETRGEGDASGVTASATGSAAGTAAANEMELPVFDETLVLSDEVAVGSLVTDEDRSLVVAVVLRTEPLRDSCVEGETAFGSAGCCSAAAISCASFFMRLCVLSVRCDFSFFSRFDFFSFFSFLIEDPPALLPRSPSVASGAVVSPEGTRADR